MPTAEVLLTQRATQCKIANKNNEILQDIATPVIRGMEKDYEHRPTALFILNRVYIYAFIS